MACESLSKQVPAHGSEDWCVTRIRTTYYRRAWDLDIVDCSLQQVHGTYGMRGNYCFQFLEVLHHNKEEGYEICSSSSRPEITAFCSSIR